MKEGDGLHFAQRVARKARFYGANRITMENLVVGSYVDDSSSPLEKHVIFWLVNVKAL